ncbi:TPA: hypothetical protein NKW13_004372 [Vibrio parahaemolyticus]|uniref:hypothetical protein n=1 Tax=Vibrio parahaemolyticus TaxID=670 RepID=UPI001E56BBE2|nr:hypothetical protein [Vibrio parahaemolyticus]HCE2641707.1 hypothetical protein [Vibrio parahaemolyticus]HCH4213712.1 hypothetical protein [Vibrio parahaemolyticus]
MKYKSQLIVFAPLILIVIAIAFFNPDLLNFPDVLLVVGGLGVLGAGGLLAIGGNDAE